MGTATTIESIWKNIECLLDKSEIDHVFKGTIFKLDTLNSGSNPKERLVQGMLVDRKAGMRRVLFQEDLSNNSQIPSSSLSIGDPVIVVGRQNSLRADTTLPLLILLPEKQTLLVSERPATTHESGPSESVLVILYCIIAVLSVPIYFWSFIFFPVLSQLREQVTIFYIAVFLLFFGILGYQLYTRRARTIHFDRESWTGIVSLIKNRLPVEVSNIFDQE